MTLGKEGIRTFARSKDKAFFTATTPGSCALADCTHLFTGGGREGRDADGPWVCCPDLHSIKRAAQEFVPGVLSDQTKAKKCQNGVIAT